MFLEQALIQTAEISAPVRVLDLCGAPGGKSTHLASLINSDSLLVANEVIRSRALVLAESVTKWGSANVLVTQNDPAVFGRLPGYFDVILVDAPCSGEGMFRTEIALNEWSEGNAIHCSERQKRIIMDVWPALKEDGLLIYSTCTFNPDENEENIRWLIDQHEAKCGRLDITAFKGVTEIDYQGIYGYGFYPDKVRGEGFFISVIRKTGRQENISVRNQRKNEYIPGKGDADIANQWFNSAKDRYLKWKEDVVALPCSMDEYLQLFQKLSVVKAGTKLFSVKNHDYLPSHELALSNHLRANSFPEKEIDFQEAMNYLKRDQFNMDIEFPGWNIITFNGVRLGFIKNLGRRFNNYYPVEWRIRMTIPENASANIIKWDQDEK